MEAARKKFKRVASRGYRRGSEPETGLREMLLQQCIVTGIIVLIALVISFLPMRFATDLRAGIRRVLAQESSMESVSQAAESLAGKYNDIKTSIRAIFGGTPAEQLTQTPENAPVNTPETTTADLPATALTETELPEEPAGEPSAERDWDARVDESLLGSDFLEAIDSEKKQ